MMVEVVLVLLVIVDEVVVILAAAFQWRVYISQQDIRKRGN